MTTDNQKRTRFRSQDWFANPDHIDLTALYLERFMNYGLTPEELRSGRPIIGIAQSGSDINPCNRVHLDLAKRVRDGIRDAGGIPIEFPVHPTFENCRRPTAAIDRNLAYMALVEILHGYPIDAVVLTTGCDKSTPSQLMAAATIDIPAIVLSGGPMLDGWFEGELVGSGAAIWKGRRLFSAGKIDEEKFFDIATASAPSVGHCNTMGTASTMNAIAEALGMSLTGCSAIPAPYRERAQIAYETGRRIVELAHSDIRPSSILTREAFLDAIVVNAAIGGSTNAQPHLMAMARHAGVELHASDWTEFGHKVPLLLNMQPAGKFLGEAFYRAGGVPAVMYELERVGLLRSHRQTVTGRTMKENLADRESSNREVIRRFEEPLKVNAGFMVLSGNLFDFAIMKTSVISDEFRQRYLSRPGAEGTFECRAIVFEDSDDYHARINDPALEIDENCILVIRGAGPVGWPGSAEVVNMQPPDALLKRGITSLPTLGDGRQSGTSDSPSILNASPESAVGGGLAFLRTGDKVKIDLNRGTCNMLVSDSEIDNRKKETPPPVRPSQTPWQEIYRSTVGQLEQGACMELAVKYHRVSEDPPRHNH